MMPPHGPIRVLGDKNKLTAVDAHAVEEAFRARLEILGGSGSSEVVEPAAADARPCRPGEKPPKAKRRRRSQPINKSVLAIPEPRRTRDRDHVRSVAQHPCLVCGRRPADAHHLRFAQGRALGRKVSDEFTVPLCRGHHREVHRCGDEAAWWRAAALDPTVAARSLWLESHPLPIGQEEPTSNRRVHSVSERPATIV